MAAALETVIAIEGLSLGFEQEGRHTRVLEDLSLQVERGEFVAIVGESGVGKSTLLRVLIGLAAPTGGTVRVSARPGPTGEAAALVFQDARLLPWRRVLANVAFGLERSHLSRTERLERVRAMLGLVGLGELAARWPHQLSGGQRQRVSLARALAVDPGILLMDEPFSALDTFTRHALQDELQRIRAATGKTVLFVTHDIDEAVYLADRVIVLAGSPAHVAAAVRIPATRPRQRNHPSLVAAAAHLRAELSGQAVAIQA